MRRSFAMVRTEEPKLELAAISISAPVPARVMAPLRGGIAGWVLRLWNGKARTQQPRKKLRMMEQISLGGKRQLALVECEGRQILVGSNEHGVQSMMLLPAAGDKVC